MDASVPERDPTAPHGSTLDLRPARPLSLEQARLVNARCERFEADWRNGHSPRIENFLSDAPADLRPFLLRELLALEVELRSMEGQDPIADDYVSRFPAREDQEVVTSLLGSTPSGGPAPGRPETFGDYQLLAPLGIGGMGVVYRARLITANRLVALKRMRFGVMATAEEARRFRLEAEAAANLEHPNIVPIYEVGRIRGQPYFTMKLLEGGGLDHQLDRFRHDHAATARLLVKVARAVHHAHENGFLHRDLKPANILLDAAGEPHVTDFGLAKRVTALQPPSADAAPALQTSSGVIVGTPSFMAPEQASAQPRPLTPATDVYGLGAVLYTMLTGSPPFLAGTVMETLVQVNEKEPVPPRRLRSGIPIDLERICLKCLEKSPEARYSSALEFADDLERYLRGEDVRARRVGIPGRARRWFRREPEVAFRLLTVGAVIALTQLNYYLLEPAERDDPLHRRTLVAESLWLLLAVVLRFASRRPGGTERIRPAWILADVGLLSGILWILRDVETTLVIGYPLLIVAAGLWSNVGLVVLATAASMLAYLGLWLAARAHGDISKPHHLDVVLLVMAMTGSVVVHHVRRVWRLSSFYEHQPDRE